jgi:ATP-binding cassette subfamily F protein 3
MQVEWLNPFAKKQDLILLDEPTNLSWMWKYSMVVKRISWLIQPKAVVVIYDKAFVNTITNRTIEVTMGRIYGYKAKYSHYLQSCEKTDVFTSKKAYDEQQRMITDNRTFIDRFQRDVF